MREGARETHREREGEGDDGRASKKETLRRSRGEKLVQTIRMGMRGKNGHEG